MHIYRENYDKEKGTTLRRVAKGSAFLFN